MAVYVDTLRQYANGKGFLHAKPTCHMYADTIEELMFMAGAIGMRKEWFQNDPRLPHFDLIAKRRAAAVALGAIEHERSDMTQFMKKLREERACTTQ